MLKITKQQLNRVIIVLFFSLISICLPQEIESLGLKNKNITSLSYYGDIIAVGTDSNGVFFHTSDFSTESNWNLIGLDSISVQTVYAHKSGAIGWAIGAGIDPETSNSPYIYCSDMGANFVENSTGIIDSLTDKIKKLTGFPDPTICGETYAAGDRVLYRQEFTDSLWKPVYTAPEDGSFLTVETKDAYPGVVLAGGILGVAGGFMLLSYDYGENWDESRGFKIFDIDFAGDSAQTIFVTDREIIRRSTNDISTWESVLRSWGEYYINKILLNPINSYLFAGGADNLDRAVLYFSSNAGDDWSRLSLDINDSIVDMAFGNDDWIYFVTPDSGVFRFKQTTMNIEENQSNSKPIKFQLLQNYPNPFNPKTIINYEIPITKMVDLSIYNLLGQCVATLVSEKQSAGSYEVEWDASQFSSGIYYYMIHAGEFQAMKKMVLIK